MLSRYKDILKNTNKNRSKNKYIDCAIYLCFRLFHLFIITLYYKNEKYRSYITLISLLNDASIRCSKNWNQNCYLYLRRFLFNIIFFITFILVIFFSFFEILECGKETAIRLGDDVRCSSCNHRIMYKKRTPNGLFFCPVLLYIIILFTLFSQLFNILLGNQNNH